MRKVLTSLILTMVVIFLASCSSQDMEASIGLIVNPINNAEGSEGRGNKTKDQWNDKEFETLRDTVIESFLTENQEYEKENIEGMRALVLDVVPIKNENQISVKLRDYDTQEILILKDEKEKFAGLKKGQDIVAITTKLWKQSAPPQNSPLKLIVL
ncbi:hypothetical protein [Paenibacillus sp. An7]|uniref:hypothetical protein n=1 Tax=Paenibacillus sp. An7 TaxID=2689577 RepID=UPI00135C0C9D|nr:hypothetical protein [Paenibacillus sp. An7]